MTDWPVLPFWIQGPLALLALALTVVAVLLARRARLVVRQHQIEGDDIMRPVEQGEVTDRGEIANIMERFREHIASEDRQGGRPYWILRHVIAPTMCVMGVVVAYEILTWASSAMA